MDLEQLRTLNRVVHQLRLLSDDAFMPDRGAVPAAYLSFLALHLFDLATDLDAVLKANLPRTSPLDSRRLPY